MIIKDCIVIFSELFQYRAFATPYKAWTLLYTLIRIQPLNKSKNSTPIPLDLDFYGTHTVNNFALDTQDFYQTQVLHRTMLQII